MIDAGAIASHVVFRAVLGALAAPGRPFALPDALAGDAPGALAAVVAAAWEPAAAIALCGSAALPHPYGSLSTAVAAAEVVVCVGDATEALAAARRGTESEPELGATVIIGSRSGGRATTVSGPGIERPCIRPLPLSASELAARNQACSAWPLGVDVLLLLDGAVVGLPRSTTAVAVAVQR